MSKESLITFANGLSDEEAEVVCSTIDKIIKRGVVYSKVNPTPQEQFKFHVLLKEFYSLPRLGLHDEREAFRKPHYDELRDKNDIIMSEMMLDRKRTQIEESDYSDSVILRIDPIEYPNGKIDLCMICAKEFGLSSERGMVKYGYTKEVYIYKSQYPKTFERCKKNLGKKSTI